MHVVVYLYCQHNESITITNDMQSNTLKTNSKKLDTEVNFRCNGVVKDKFYSVSKANGAHPAKTLRELMDAYIEQNCDKISQKQSSVQ